MSASCGGGELVLVTGGCGYIGSHTVVELVTAGFRVIVIDNFINSSRESIARVEKITGQAIPVVEADVLDYAALDAVFAAHGPFSAVLHFAALKGGQSIEVHHRQLYHMLSAVGESTTQPLRYYENNVTGTIRLLAAMEKHGVRRFIFSSSATVYGDPIQLPIPETHAVGACTNPYGQSKHFVEQICQDVAKANAAWDIVILRYFNPIGAHISGLIGEDPKGLPNNLVPFVAQVAVGRRAELSVFGDQYPTPDGTGVRDYIHVVDLALGHVAALRRLLAPACGLRVYNLGSGQGVSVLDIVKAFEKASGRTVKFKVVAPRPGDIAACYADASKALAELNWKTERDLARMCEDSWRWQQTNPDGYSATSVAPA